MTVFFCEYQIEVMQLKFCRIDDDMFFRYSECMDEIKELEKYGEFINGKVDATDEER